MSGIGWLQAIVFFLIVLAVTKPLGSYMARVFSGERTWLSSFFAPVERMIYRACGVREDAEMTWYVYALSMLAFSVIGFIYLYVLLRTQKWLPFNPQHVDNMAPDLAWNTAVSFLTNTNWQFYSGEQAMSYLSQMAGLAWHNFVSAAVGIAVAVAVVRGLVRTSVKTLGNFWVDLTRCSLYVLLPIAVIFGLFFVSEGIPQNFHANATVHSIEGFTQSITGGPMASQEVIKEAGTNGGGFVNANSASPNENPSPLTNLVEMLLIFALGAGLTYMYGRMVKDTRQGWAIFTAMAILFFVGFTVAYWAESVGNPIVHQLGIAGGNMEGKECRFGTAASALFATVTTDTSCGAVNAMHDSFMPLGALVPLVDMQLGEIVFGGVGSGLYGMIVFVVLTVF
ncbi:MAG: potassium-transporting ATPase subunit KdpA, partial [Candidatus Cybelea sp.]